MQKKKVFDIIQHQFIIKTLSTVGTKGNFLNLMKNICKKSIANITFNGEKTAVSPSRTGTKTSMSPLTIPINIILEGPASTIRQEEGIKDVQVGKK